jgi:acyl-[acyl carrier protein]--UDP-N-acetylglucosamine O-acyltransferase
MSSTAYDDQYTVASGNINIGATPNIANTITINTANAGGFFGSGGGGSSGMYMVNSGISHNANSMSTTVLSIMAEGDGDAMIKTKKNTINLDEMARMMETVKERLLILTPAFEKHEQYPALKEAYDHYKLIEALCKEENNEQTF